MKTIGVFLCKRIPFPFHRIHMHHHRRAKFLGPIEHMAQLIQIMPIYRPQVLKTHVLKKAAGPQRFFDTGLYPVDAVIHGPATGKMVHHVVITFFELIISGPCAYARQMRSHAAHVLPDGHAIVVQQDDQRFLRGAGIV